VVGVVALGSIVELAEADAEGDAAFVGDDVVVEPRHPATSTIVIMTATRARNRGLLIGTLLPAVRGLPSEVM
jgi:hypothetical protein